MLTRALALCLIVLSCSAADARAHRLRPREIKIFSAKRNSIEFENEVADTMGAFRYSTQEEVNNAVQAGKLVPLRTVGINRRLPSDRRYALPDTVAFIEQLSNEFNGQFNHVLVVNSAVRPATVQRRLLRWNRSAAPAYGGRASTHTRGTNVDLSKKMNKEEHRWMIFRLLYYRAIGRVLVIEERGCFHIFVRSDQL